MTLPGKSKTIHVEPIKTPGPPQREPAPEKVPAAPPPEREPEKTPA